MNKLLEECTNPEEIETIILEKDFIANDENFAKLPIGTLKILKIFLLKGHVLNQFSYDIIMSDVFCDEEYYEICNYLYTRKYILPTKMQNDAIIA